MTVQTYHPVLRARTVMCMDLVQVSHWKPSFGQTRRITLISHLHFCCLMSYIFSKLNLKSYDNQIEQGYISPIWF